MNAPDAMNNDLPLAPRSDAARPDSSGIQVEIAPHFAGGELHGRHDAILLGRAVAAMPIESIALEQDGTVLARLEFPPGSPADLPPAPLGGPPQARGFMFVLARPIAAAALVWEFALRVVTTDGAEAAFPCAARREAGGDGGWLERGRGWAAPEQGPAAPVIVYVERAAIDASGQLAVTGWGIARRRLLAVQAFLDGERVGAALLGVTRDDVAALFPGYPGAAGAGFTLTGRLGRDTAMADRLAISAVAEDGTTLTLSLPLEHPPRLDLAPAPPAPDAPEPPPRDVAAERRRIDAFCDLAEADADGVARITGWAVSALGIGRIAVVHRGRELGEAQTGRPRPDVGEQFLTIPMARHAGFAFEGILPEPPGQGETIELRIHNGAGEIESVRAPLTRRERPAAPAGQPAPAPDLPLDAPDGEAFRLELDRPVISDDTMVEPVTSRLTLEGWALARAGITAITVYLDGQRLGEAHTGLARQDVERALPDWPGALRSGFAFHFPPRLLRDGTHRAEIVLRAEDGTNVARGFGFTVHRGEEAADAMTIRPHIDPGEATSTARALERMGARAAFRFLILDADRAPPEALAATLASLRAQILCPWQADLLVADAAAARALRQRRAEAGETDALGVLVAETAPVWPPANCDDAVLCGLLGAGDRLDAGALAEFALARALDPDADFLYADESRISPVGGEREAFFKPDFSPDLLHATAYIGRPWVASAALLRRVGRGLPGPAGDTTCCCAPPSRAARSTTSRNCWPGAAPRPRRPTRRPSARRSPPPRCAPGGSRASNRASWPAPGGYAPPRRPGACRSSSRPTARAGISRPASPACAGAPASAISRSSASRTSPKAARRCARCCAARPTR